MTLQIPELIRTTKRFQTGSAAFEAALKELGNDAPPIAEIARLDSNENPYPSLVSPEAGLFANIHQYLPLQPEQLTLLVAELFRVPPSEQIVICNGLDGGIEWLVRACCEPKRDAVIICPPAFPKYAHASRFHWLEVIEIPLLSVNELGHEKLFSFRLDIEKILDSLRQRANGDSPIRILFIASPNNPTGHAETISDLEFLLQQSQRISPQTLIFLDEAYWGFHSLRYDALAKYQNLARGVTLSKAFGLAGLRLAALFLPSILRDAVLTVAPYVPLSTASFACAVQALSSTNISTVQRRLQIIVEERERLSQSILDANSIQKVFKTFANFIAFQVRESHEFVLSSLRQGIFVRDVSQALGAGCIRATIGQPYQNDQLITAIGNFDSV